MNWNSDDIELIEKFIGIKNRGYYASGVEVTEVYNRVFDRNLQPTNCGSCIRQRINEMEVALKKFKAEMEEAQNKPSEALSPDMEAVAAPREKEAIVEAGNGQIEAVIEKKETKRRGRPKKK